MKKRAVAFLMSLTLGIGNMISMPTYAAQETTVESVEDITAEEEAGGTEEKDESEEAEEPTAGPKRWSQRRSPLRMKQMNQKLLKIQTVKL